MAAKISDEPVYVPLKEWCRRTGYSRSGTYRALAAGEPEAIKDGRALRINFEKGIAKLRSKPTAKFTASKK